LADDRSHYGWGRIMQDKDLLTALEKMGGVVIDPHRRAAGFGGAKAEHPKPLDTGQRG
jgi:hypothetical protein